MKRGTTLLEILAVLGILGIFSSIASMSFINARSAGRSREATRLLVSYLRNARSLSVTSGLRHGVYLGGSADAANPGFRSTVVMYRKASPDTATSPRTYQVGDTVVSRTALPDFGLGGRELLRLEYDVSGAPAVLASPNSLQVSFDLDGRPNVTELIGGSETDLTPAMDISAAKRLVMRLRDPQADSAGLNPTSRCTEMRSTGSSKNLHADVTRPECL